MLGKLSGWDDTIVALATPPGVGAIGVLRVSGKFAIDIVDSLFQSKNLNEQTSHTVHVGLLKEHSVVLDQVVVSLFKAPSSYTGEHVVEISSHGSPFVQEKIINAITARGARLAKPGEFTQRAFLNGKIDLTQAEAVADLILSNTEVSRKTALQNIRGGFSEVLRNLRDQLLSFSALIELELDFSQEDVEFADRKKLYQLITSAQETNKHLIDSFALGNVIKNGVQVAIIGKPNAGKSTLLNALLNEDRAIVSEIAGTTRDTIEEVLNINGILFRLIDTAGIRDNTDNVIESMGVEKSYEKMDQADVIIYLFDVNDIDVDELKKFIEEQHAKNKKYVLVGNKIDQADQHIIANHLGDIDALFISAIQAKNIEQLKERLFHLVITGNVTNESTIITNARHYEFLRLVNTALDDILIGMNSNLSSDLLSLDIRRCLHYLGEITGEITNEDQLDYIFSKFCIGK
jgi:tRNA modification GTPase